MRAFILVLAIASLPFYPSLAADWPTHRFNNARSGDSPESLQLPLQLQWQVKLPTPEPAWPPPAKQDYWHRQTNLSPRVVHDRANSVVVAQRILVVGSSADDCVRAFDVATGKLRWTVWTEGPVRLAPSIWSPPGLDESAIVVFAADDGFVYGVELHSGKLLWQTRPREVGTRRISGNGRLISQRPIRSGVMVNDEGTGFFAAGIFPLHGAFYYTINVRDGSVLDRASIDKSIQGYLQQQGDSVFAATGRDLQGTRLAGTRASAGNREAPDAYAAIRDHQRQYLGKQDRIEAVKGDAVAWTATVDGRIYDLAISDGYLLASSDSGWIYAFHSGPSTLSPSTTRLDRIQPDTLAPSPGVSEIGPVGHRYALLIDPRTDAELQRLFALAGNEVFRTVVTVSDSHRADQIRQLLESQRKFAAVHVNPSTAPLPYADNLFHRIHGGTKDSVRQLVHPYGGRAECLDGIVLGTATSSDDWSHAYGNAGNTASSTARVGGSDLRLQWFGGPGPRDLVDRHLRTMPPLVRNGTMYLPGLNQVIAVDAYTGAIRWQQYIPNSTRIGILKDCGWMVATDDGLLVANGSVLTRYQASEGQDEPNVNDVVGNVVASVPLDNREWGYLARVGDRIVGSSMFPGSSRKTVNRDAILEGAYTDNRPIVCSDVMFSLRPFEGSDTTGGWKYTSRGAILNPTIAANQAMVVFLESACPDLESSGGRLTLKQFLAHQPRLVALNLESGEPLWQHEWDNTLGVQNAFIVCDEKRLALVNSRNAKTVQYDVRVFAASDGSLLWEASQDNGDKVGGDHGEQDKHPVLVGERLIVEPFAYDIRTGEKLADINLAARGYGCGTISASADALFFRSGNPAKYSLETGKLDRVTSVTRPGCWINMIPAAGMLLIPEGSSGCTCNFAIQASMALVPVAQIPGPETEQPQ